jgi:hypothetical protein
MNGCLQEEIEIAYGNIQGQGHGQPTRLKRSRTHAQDPSNQSGPVRPLNPLAHLALRRPMLQHRLCQHRIRSDQRLPLHGAGRFDRIPTTGLSKGGQVRNNRTQRHAYRLDTALGREAKLVRAQKVAAIRNDRRATEDDDKYADRCWNKRQQLERVNAELRAGYKTAQGVKLRRRRSEYEAFLSRYCR